VIHVANPNDLYCSQDIVQWDNDIVPESNPDIDIHCSVRKVSWVYNPASSFRPKSPYIYKAQIDGPRHIGYHPTELTGTTKYNAAVHSFAFYMGSPLRRYFDGEKTAKGTSRYTIIPNGIDGSRLIDTQARDKILGYIKSQLKTKDPNKVCVSNFFKYYGDGTIHDSLKKGDKDAQSYSDGTKHQVKELQEFLEAFGYDVGSSGADGWFGSDTESALIDFQAANDLDADGIVGIQTREAMNNTNCYDKP